MPATIEMKKAIFLPNKNVKLQNLSGRKIATIELPCHTTDDITLKMMLMNWNSAWKTSRGDLSRVSNKSMKFH